MTRGQIAVVVFIALVVTGLVMRIADIGGADDPRDEFYGAFRISCVGGSVDWSRTFDYHLGDPVLDDPAWRTGARNTCELTR